MLPRIYINYDESMPGSSGYVYPAVFAHIISATRGAASGLQC